ncbi:hypothetical protein Tco_1298539 [Tanacetum coccineum]
MEILPVSSSNSTTVVAILLIWQPALKCLISRTSKYGLLSKYGESNASVLEDLTLRAGNPIKEVLIINLPDHRY